MQAASRSARRAMIGWTLMAAVGAAMLALGGIGGVGGAAHAQQPTPGVVFLPLALRVGIVPPAVPDTPAPPTATATATPSATPTEPATATAVSSPEPSPTDPPTVTSTPTLEPTATTAAPAWLARCNEHRALARLGPVVEEPEWSRGGEMHSRYMVKNDFMSHSEQSSNRWYTAEGREAGENGNVQVSTNIDRPVDAAIDMWMTEPFHQVAMLDPQLAASGYGEWREAVGRFHFGATLDVLRGRTADAADVRFPVRYPEMDTVFPLRSYDGNETPDPLTSCYGYTAPTGPPLVLMLGPGNVVPRVNGVTFTDATGTVLPSCWFDQTTYRNGSSPAQTLGRGVLALRSAVVVMPRNPLAAGTRYTVRIVNDAAAHAWSFRTAEDTTPPFTPMPPVDQAVEDELLRLIGEQRQLGGLPELVVSPRLTHAARRHTRDMAANGIGGHIGSDGSTPEDRVRATGYGNCLLSADFATGWGGDPAAVVGYWMSVPATRAHVLSDKREVGVGFAVNPDTALVHYWYVYYATPQ